MKGSQPGLRPREEHPRRLLSWALAVVLATVAGMAIGTVRPAPLGRPLAVGGPVGPAAAVAAAAAAPAPPATLPPPTTPPLPTLPTPLATPSATALQAPPAAGSSHSSPPAASGTLWQPHAAVAVPVLMYHVIGHPTPHAPWAGLYVSPRLFAAQMKALRGAGFQAITLSQAYAAWRGLARFPRHPVILSFDDGYTGDATRAAPILRRLGWPGVLCQQVHRLNFPGGLTPAQVRGLLSDGWELADHGVTQPETELVGARPSLIHYEVFASRRDLRRLFGTRVRFFCYPLGNYDPQVVRAVRQAGFAGAISTVPGPADPAVEGYWHLERVRVWAGEPPAQVVAGARAASRTTPPPPPRRFG